MLKLHEVSAQHSQDYNSYPPSQRQKAIVNDFKAVFFGHSTPEQGQRVFQKIKLLCEGSPISPGEISNTHLTAFRQGMRWFFHEINRCLIEPRDVKVQHEEE